MRVQAGPRGWHPRSRPGGSRQWLPLLGDAALALVLAAVAVAVPVLRPGIPHRGVAVALAVVQTLPLVFPRRPPLWVPSAPAAAPRAPPAHPAPPIPAARPAGAP